MKQRKIKWAARAMAGLLTLGLILGSVGMAAPMTAKAAATEKNPLIDATKKGSLKIQKTDADKKKLSGATFTIYKVMDLAVDGTTGRITYSVAEAFEDVIDTEDVDALGNYSSVEIEKLVNNLLAATKDLTVDSGDTKITDNNGEATFTDLELGYYLVVETEAPSGYVAGKPFLVAIPSTDNYTDTEATSPTSTPGTEWIYDVTAKPKNVQVTVDKEFAGDDEVKDSSSQDGTAAVGDWVKYEVTATIPNYSDEYFEDPNTVKFEFRDVMARGLLLANENDTKHKVEVKTEKGDAIKNTDYTVKVDPNAGVGKPNLTVSLLSNYIKAHRGEKVTLTYWARITSSASNGTVGNENEVTLEYTNKPGISENTETVTDDKEVYTFQIKVEKFTNEETTKLLDGVEFELYKGPEFSTASKIQNTGGNGTWTSFKGMVTFPKLDEGTYWLEEVKSPNGYTLLANPIKVEITDVEIDETTKKLKSYKVKVDGVEITNTGTASYVTRLVNNEAIIAVENHKGFNLPATGGMGIAFFLIIGAAGIMVLSVVMTRKTKKSE